MTEFHVQKAMILAAGKGTRMRHLSRTVPKPMTRIQGSTLIDRALDHVVACGLTAVVNVHHLADTLEAHLGNPIRKGIVTISDERDMLLETGGGIKKALPLIGTDPFLSINGDALWTDTDAPIINRLIDAFKPDTMDMLVMLVPVNAAHGYDGAGDFIIAGTAAGNSEPCHILSFRGDAAAAPYMFGGIMITKPTLFAAHPSQGPWSSVELMKRAAQAGRLMGLVHHGLWIHVGTPEAITEAETILNANAHDTVKA